MVRLSPEASGVREGQSKNIYFDYFLAHPTFIYRDVMYAKNAGAIFGHMGVRRIKRRSSGPSFRRTGGRGQATAPDFFVQSEKAPHIKQDGSPQKKPRIITIQGFSKLMPGNDLLSHGETPHYHRRSSISLLSSGWDQVGLERYCCQANRLGNGGQRGIFYTKLNDLKA